MLKRPSAATVMMLMCVTIAFFTGCCTQQTTPGEGEQMMQVQSELLSGPAADLHISHTPASPNRLGSAEVPVRIYEPQEDAWATLVWAHGGSFLRGTLDWPEADWAARQFAVAGLRVYSVDYVLASESVKAPAPANDVAAALRAAIANHSGDVFIGGASAGAHLAALAALTQHDYAGEVGAPIARPADALLMLYPTAHRTQRAEPTIDALTADLPANRRFGPERIAEMYDYYLGDMTTASATITQYNAYSQLPLVLGELGHARLSQLPATIIVNAETDDLRASGEEFAQQLNDAGVRVVQTTEPTTLHGYLNRPEESVIARETASRTIERFVRELRTIHQQ